MKYCQIGNMRQAICAKTVVALVAIAFLALSTCGCRQESASQGDELEEPISSSAEADDRVSSESASAIVLDLATSSDRILINRCLSWMSQAYAYSGSAIDVSDPNDQVLFAVHHVGLTNYSAWESGDYTSIAGAGAGANGATNMRVATRYIDDVVSEFFGTTLDYSSLNGSYKKVDDYIYFGVTAPAGQVAAYSAATSLVPNDDGSYTASFEVYSNALPYMDKDDSFYGETPSGMMAAMGVSSPRCTGAAVLRPVERSGQVSVVVESYDIDEHTASGTSGKADDREPAVQEFTVISTPYYTIGIPAGWPEAYGGEFTYKVSEDLNYVSDAPELGMGCSTIVFVGTGEIHVNCFTNNWGAQGDYVAKELGEPSNLVGWRVVVYTNRVHPDDRHAPSDLSSLLDEFSTFIKLA